MINIDMFVEAAKQNLVNCVAAGKDFFPVSFFERGGTINVCMLEVTDKNKYQIYEQLGATLYRLKCDEVILANDCAMKEYEDVDKVDVTEMPLTYPESMRTEVLVLMHVNFKTNDTYRVISYKKNDGTVQFIKEETFDEVGGAIRHNIAKGFALEAGEDMIRKQGKTAEDVYKEYPNLKDVRIFKDVKLAKFWGDK